MNPSRIFIDRPVATSLLMIAILLVGIVAFRFLPLSALPEVDYPTIQVQTFYPGASPEVMTSSVTAPLERQFGQMPSLSQMMSQSSAGASVITLRFGLDISLDIAEQEVQAAINAAGNLLPADLPAPPIYAKVNPADAPILTLGVASDSMKLTDVEDILETRLVPKLSQLPGVGLVSISGGQRPAVRIHVNPLALSGVGINLDDLRTTIANLNVNEPKGNFDGPAQSSAINANDQIRDPKDYANAVIAYRNNAPVRLSDVARVEIAPENSRLKAWMNTTPALIVNIQRQPGANVIQVVDSIKKILPSLSQSLPAAITVTPLTDRTITIRASVEDVEFELSLAVGLVVMVIFLFLRNIPATIIPSLSVPLSLIGALAIMYQAGFSLDNLSLMALTIATGFVVDDAIVVIENIARFLEAGDSPYDAAMKGSAQIGFTIISLTVSLIAVLIPLLFMGDVVGRLFHEFAITLAATIIISAIVSLTLVPMLCAKLLRPHGRGGDASGGRFFQALTRFYAATLRVVLDHQGVMLLVALGTFLLTGYLYVTIPKGFFPIQDTGVIQGVTQAAEAISFDQMADHQQALAKAILTDPDVESLSSFIGVDGSNVTLNSGRFLINLKPHDKRKATASEIIRRLQQETASVPGISLFMQPVQDLSIDTAVSATQYQFTLENQDLATLQTWTPKVLARLGQIKSIVDVASDLQPDGRSVMVDLDRANAARFGITPAIVDNALYDAYGQRIITTIFTQSNQYRVILDVDPNMARSVKSLDSLYLPSAASTTGQTPLDSVANFTVKTAPLQISHLKQFPVTTISFNLAPGASLGEAVDAISGALAEIDLPPSFAVSFQGAAQAFQSALSNEVFLLAAAIAAMYIVLGVLYESFIHPITILTTLPSAGIGALLTLNAAGAGLDIIGVIGIVLLIGIVKKNAIMMIDFALEAQRHQGLPAREAIYQACLLAPEADPDDDGCGDFRRAAVDARDGRRLRASPSAGSGDRRRPRLQPGADPLYHAGHLSLLRAARRAFRHGRRRFGAGDGSAVNNRFSEIFIRRPVATILLTIGVVFAGLLGYSQLPVSPLPQVDFPVISVQANMPGASPDTMATSVAAPLERHLGQIADVNEMSSQSTLGSTRITLQFGLDRDIDGAARDVQAAIVAARVDLPTSLRQNPTYHKVNPADAPIMVIAMSSTTHTAGQLYDLASNILQQRLSQLPGIGEVDISGAALPAVRVEINPGAIFHYGIGLEDIRAALASANANSPKGAIEDDDFHYQVYANDQASHADQYRDLVIAYRNGAPVRLGDVAEVLDSVEDLRNAGLVNGKPGVAVILSRQPGANIIQAVDGVRAELPRLIASLPGDVDLTVAVDRSKTIRQSLHDTEKTLVIAVVLVILVVFAFLRSVRAAAIPSVAVPTSIIGSFGVMYLLGFSLDNLSLMALTISTGFVVDDAIVVLENISRYLEQGMPRVEAAIRGAGEVGFTVISISLSLIAVFAPLLFFGGIVGRLFTEFALTLSVAVMISMLVSLTTTPMMCALILPSGPVEHGRLYQATERVFDAMLAFYRRTLRIALRHPGTVALSLFGHGRAQLLHVPLSYHLWLVSGAGHGPHHRRDPGRPKHLLPGDEGEVHPVAGHRPGGPRGRKRRRLHRRAIDQLRLSLRVAEAVFRAQGHRRRGRDPAAPQAGASRGRAAFHGRRLRPENRRATEQRDLSIYAPLRRHGGALYVGAEADPGADGQRYCQGRQFGSADGRSADQRHDRSRHRDAPRSDAELDRQHALRRVRSAPGVDDLQPAQPIPCRDGGRAALLAGPAHPRPDLRFDVRRQSDRRPADRTPRGRLRLLDRDGEHSGVDRRRFGAQPRHQRLGGERSLIRFDWRGGNDLARNDGPALGLRSFCSGPYAAQRQSPGTVRGDHDLVQPCRGPLAQRGQDRDRQRDRAHRHALDRPRRLRRHRCDLSAVAVEHAASVRRRDRHDLSCARDSLREPDPSDHHPLDPVLRQRRRGAGAVVVRRPIHHHRRDRGLAC